MIATFKEKHPNIPVALYMAGSGGLLERMQSTGADVIALDWSIDLADARQRLGVDQALQVAFYSSLLLFSPSSSCIILFLKKLTLWSSRAMSILWLSWVAKKR